EFHAHIGKSKVFGKGFVGAKTLVEMMDQNKIDKAVLIPTASPPKPRYYEDVVDALKEFPDRFYGFFLANPKEENVCDMLDMVVNKYGFLGVKLHPTFLGFAADDHDLVYPIVEKAKELKICVMIHSDPSIYATPWQVGLLAMDFPDVPVVMAHMGFIDIIYNDAAINMAKRAPNLYLETCGVSAESKVTAAVREIGASRVLYGSDMPFHNPAFDMARIEYADISEEEKKLIMGENAKRLLDSLGKN
ncbi:MAG: amidohydrolase family protein, partial [Desulfatiglandales bacterium]